MRSRYNVHWDEDILDIVSKAGIREAHERGDRIVWYREGAVGVIPDAILDAEFKLFDDFKVRRRTYDRVPESVGVISWNQVVQVYGDGFRGHDPVGIRT